MLKIFLVIFVLVTIPVAYYLISPIFIDQKIEDDISFEIIEPQTKEVTKVENKVDNLKTETESKTEEVVFQDFVEEVSKEQKFQEKEVIIEAPKEQKIEKQIEIKKEVPKEEKENVFSETYNGLFEKKAYQTSGQVKVIENQEERFLILENLKSNNGPDLDLVLSKTESWNKNDFIKVADLKGNLGNQKYNLNKNIDLDQYKYLLIFCEDFSYTFGFSKISSA